MSDHITVKKQKFTNGFFPRRGATLYYRRAFKPLHYDLFVSVNASQHLLKIFIQNTFSSCTTHLIALCSLREPTLWNDVSLPSACHHMSQTGVATNPCFHSPEAMIGWGETQRSGAWKPPCNLEQRCSFCQSFKPGIPEKVIGHRHRLTTCISLTSCVLLGESELLPS